MQNTSLRYQLPKKAIKGECPDCAPKYRKTLSRYIDTRTGEPLPKSFGRCDRESNCGYHLSPYAKGASGVSYADQVYEQWKADNSVSTRSAGAGYPKSYIDAGKESKRRFPANTPNYQSVSNPSPSVAPMHYIPEEVFRASIGQYERNQLATLLQQHFGLSVADELLNRFQIGTSTRWPGACVFWLKDQQSRVRGGQVVLFDESGHTAKRSLPNGEVKRYTSWVHTALAIRYNQKRESRPAWLTDYIDNADKFPIPFGLHQLKSVDSTAVVAIVESPKTAIICTPYFPQFVWMAVGGLSYLNSNRLTPLLHRKLVLFPDLNAYHDRTNENGQIIRGWLSRVQELETEGFNLTISDYLEQRATDEEKAKGLDLADYLLDKWRGYPPDWDNESIM